MRRRGIGTVVRRRLALRPGRVVLVDREGTLRAGDLLDLVRLRRATPGSSPHSVPLGLADLPATAPLRQVLVTALAADGELLLRSSGTTLGQPRLQRRGPLSAKQLVMLLDLARRVGLRPGRTVASAAPGVHGHGLQVALGALGLGAVLVDLSHLPSRPRIELLHRTSPDLLTGVPVHLSDVLTADLEHAAKRSLRVPRVISGSDRLDDELRADLARRFRARVHDVYGTSETGSLTVDGKPLRGVRIREREGLLHVRSPFTAGREIVTDRGEVTARGRVVVQGRADGQISSGGMLHHPHEVAWLLHERPGVRAAQLRAVPDARFGLRTIAEVELGELPAGVDPPTAEELRALVHDRLGPAAVPRQIFLSTRED